MIKEGLDDILHVSDEDGLLSGVQIRIRMDTENRGTVELYMFDHCYEATAFINGPDHCFMEGFVKVDGNLRPQ